MTFLRVAGGLGLVIAIECGFLVHARVARTGSPEDPGTAAGVGARKDSSGFSKPVAKGPETAGRAHPETPKIVVQDYLELISDRESATGGEHPSVGQLRQEFQRDPKTFLEEASKLETLEGSEAWQWADLLLLVTARFSPEEMASILPAPEVLVQKLRSDGPQVRYLWVALAGGSEQESVRAEVLRLATTDPETWVRAKALGTCAALSADERFGSVVLEAARGGTPACRYAAIRALPSVNLPGTVAGICSGLDSSDSNIRSAAYEALVERARSDPAALAEISRLSNTSLGTEDAKRLWNELSRKALLSKIAREDLARLEALTGARR